MDIRTYGQTQRTLRRENSRLQAENERLRNELAAMESYWRNAESLSETLRAELGQCISENNQLAEHIAELQSDDVYTERQKLINDNVRLFHDNNTLRAELADAKTGLASYQQHATEYACRRQDEINALRAELDAERNAHNATAAQLYAKLDAQAKRHADVIERWKVEENTWHEFDKEQLTQIAALRAELDAMRQAHSATAARMEAMGC